MFVLDGPGYDRLSAVSIGTGRVAVVLAHQAGGFMFDWWPYARSLAGRFRVVAFDFDGSGASPPGHGDYPGEVAAAAGWARQHGSRQIVLMGASMGGTAVMVAAADLGDSVAGVVDLSGAAVFAGVNALIAARRVQVPVLFAYGTEDAGAAGDVLRVRWSQPSREIRLCGSRVRAVIARCHAELDVLLAHLVPETLGIALSLGLATRIGIGCLRGGPTC